MTELRPEHDADQDGPYEQGAYGAAGAFEAAVDRLADPLNDPLPHSSPWFRAGSGPDGAAEAPVAGQGQHRAPDLPAQTQPGASQSQAVYGAQGRQGAPQEWYDPEGFERDWYGQQAAVPTPAPAPMPTPIPASMPTPMPGPVPEQSVPEQLTQPLAVPFPVHDETIGLRTADTRRPAGRVTPTRRPGPGPGPDADPSPDFDLASDADRFEDPTTDPATDPSSDPARDSDASAAEPRTGGRAERRRAAKGRGRRRTDQRPEAVATAATQADKPMSRVEARRAARAAKDSPAVVASRVTGELFITLGVLMLLFVTYQLWWTNVRADQYAGKETHKIQDDWAKGDRNPGVFEAGQGFAIIHIPKLDVVAPIAEGISKEKVLDRGMVGHYSEGTLRTAMPSAKRGNFALAGHRNTHGEPFRYINRLSPGDLIVVETQDAYYTYETARTLPQTSPSNISVIDPVPRGSGFDGPGRYITLTTCTPEFTSTYRLIVWGKMVDERPRSEGKPDALVG
ncbi:class E sortase [Streptomyces sp. NBC_00378]|uniref:class E sortase n=1 Tax=Streptomyces sp. NBC_00378 TaxID=2975732 RepID=UPI00224ECD22|nr:MULTISPECIES: class E sortase [unclassified Streptomyces]MCX5110796.1 class E sortase [Streptomyces sp. NBC_00378]